MADQDRRDDDRHHLDELEDGCGCAEVWEHLSEQREKAEAARQETAGATR
ncbi:hypothetical protein ACFQPA_05075 [Halomarina halobia]|uniref:Uncharacterized protein n=1 Tax=Halomarina halobia TaxID=3033386 RepID=A0ABD6A6M9_9EURY|nr:hypothetical protein [Halomarina sp. PSR21]